MSIKSIENIHIRQNQKPYFHKKIRLNSAPERMWINTPSALQLFHEHNGKNVLTYPPITYDKNGAGYIRIYFTKGDLISMIFPILYLSQGWIHE